MGATIMELWNKFGNMSFGSMGFMVDLVKTKVMVTGGITKDELY